MCSQFPEISSGKGKKCIEWTHCYCASVCLTHYEVITSDTEEGDTTPFMCPVLMKSTIQDLKMELQLLRGDVE